MVAVAVTFDGTRLHNSDTNTGWGKYNSGGGSPASEGANAYQITTGAAANTGVVGVGFKGTTLGTRGGVDYNGSAVDYTAAANRLLYAKVYVTDAFDLNTTYGAELSMGSVDQSNFHEYCVAGTDSTLPVYTTWPAQGGYLITCIDPTIDTWAVVADSGGATDQTAIVWYGFAAVFIAGNSKSENIAFDAIDYGTGLTLLNGTGADNPGTYVSYVDEDQDLITNRWGAAIGGGNAVIFRGVATVGATGTATEFDDSTSIVTFPDGYHSRGLFGVNMDIQNASTIITDGGLLIGEGTRNGVDANDTRPDYDVVGTAGAYTFTGVMRNFRDVTFTSVCDVNGEVECHLLTQASANIENAIIKTNALTNVACLQDPTFGATTDLNNTEFEQTGVGHAIELDTVQTYDLTNITFTGYGGTPGSNLVVSSGAADAAVYNSSGGEVTIQVAGGDSPSVRNAAGSTTIVTNSVTLSLTGIETDSEVRIINLDDVINFNRELAGSEQIAGSVLAATIADGGSGYTNGTQTLTVVGGTGTAAQVSVEVVAGVVDSINNISVAGSYTANPPTPATTSGGGGTGATLRLTIAGTFDYTYDSSLGVNAAIIVFHLNFKQVRIEQVLPAANSSIPIQQNVDRTYNNP